ncbi:MAG: TldD/PmbA family protein [Desulfobacteraceae bacterium]|jgi:predicted Zn-dependent protease
MKKTLNRLKKIFLETAPKNTLCSLRFVNTEHEVLSVRQNIVEPVETSEDQGAMITVYKDGGLGYGATCDLSNSGIGKAFDKALLWAKISKKYPVVDFSKIEMPLPRGSYASVVDNPWEAVSLNDKIDFLKETSAALKIGDPIVDWQTYLWQMKTKAYYVTSQGGEAYQESSQIAPDISVTANEGSETQKRSFDGRMAYSRQGGFEILEDIAFKEKAKQVAEEAMELLYAKNCPSGQMDLVLDPSQMMLQIHESIGHPLEIDRILGDERNYAGTSFVKPEMFGSYQYGSEQLNIVFDPRMNQLATYRFDDDGSEANKAFLIEKGVLKRGLGGAVSQARSGLRGVANSRAMNWNRPPIDRMANLNLEPASATFDELVGSVEKGVFMTSNKSWSIDDSRNKFQFGCEYGRLIENGQLTKVIKNPNYRGISATFWRNLKGVGSEDTLKVMGTPFCGKGEPNQIIAVGHASPVCLFSDIAVFGGE